MSSASYAADLGLYLRPASMVRATDVSVSKTIAAMISQMEKSIVVKSGSLVWQRACEGSQERRVLSHAVEYFYLYFYLYWTL